MAGAASPSPRPPLRRPWAGAEELEPPPRAGSPPAGQRPAPRPAWQLSRRAPGQPHSQHALGPGQGGLSQHAMGQELLSQHAPGHGQGGPSQHAPGQPHSQHAMGHGQGGPSQHAPGHEPLSQHAMGHGQGGPSQHAPEQPHSQHAMGHSQGGPSQHAPGQPHSQHAMGHGQGGPSQHAPEQPHSQHAMGHGQGGPSQHAPGHEPLSQHAMGHGQGGPSQHAPGHEPLSQHAMGHGQGGPSQHAPGQPHSQHAMGHGQGGPSQHAPGYEPLSQHAMGHGQGGPSQHAVRQQALSQHAMGHSKELPSHHAVGHGQDLHSQHAMGHSEEGLPQDAVGPGQEALSQHAMGPSQEVLSQHAVGHSKEPPSQHAMGPGQEPLSQHAVGPGQEPLSHHAAGARRVLFADALGLPLTRLRRYQPWPPPSPESPPEILPPTGQPPPVPYLLPAFVLPPAGQGEPERLARLRQAMVELEEVLAPGPGEPWLLRGTVRVLNVAYHKAVHVRATRDRWRSFRDHPARYVPGGSPDGGLSDRFAFSLPFGPGQRGQQGEEEEGADARLDFVIRYQTDEGIYWANNQGRNYSVVMKGLAPPRAPPRTPHQDGTARQLKSCMRPERMRPCEEEPSHEGTPHPAREEEGSPERETRRESPSAATGQVPELLVAPMSPEAEPPARELPVPLAESAQPPEAPWGGPGPEAGSLGPGASFSVAGLVEQAGLWQAEEEAVDSELEQLYLSHLSRLRAEELGGARERPGGPEASGSPPAWLPTLRLSVLSDRDLVVGWAGPERALNSSLAQEITLRYASPPAGAGRESPPALLEGAVRGAGPGGALRLLAPAAVVVPARTAALAWGGWGGPRGLGEPREEAPGCPTRLGQALTRSLLVLGLVVVLPVVLSGCLPAVAVTLYVVLTWRQAS